MVSSIQDVERKMTELRKIIDDPKADVQKCKTQFDEFKKTVASIIAPDINTSPSVKDILFAVEVLECGVFLAIRSNDEQQFERYTQQLLVYYFDHQELPKSPRWLSLLGMYLLHLLASRRMGDFHLLLERIPIAYKTDVSIRHPIELEQHLTDGNYNKVIKASRDVPTESYKYFTSKLLESVRERSAACMEAAYDSVKSQHAMQSLLMENTQQLEKYCQERNNRRDSKKKWILDGPALRFKLQTEEKRTIDSMDVIHSVVEYATELERIV